MSTANNTMNENTANESNNAPWIDWKIDSGFLSEINKYCDEDSADHSTKFSDIVGYIINGIRKAEEILV